MVNYSFQAADGQGKKLRGVIEARSLEEAKERLKRQNLICFALAEKRERKALFARKYLSRDEVSALVRELADLLSCSLPLYESLISLEEKYRGSKSHPIVLGLIEKIKSGSSLSSAMGAFPETFDPIALAMVQTGEASGDLARALQAYSAFRERGSKLRKAIGSALIYPLVLLTLSLALLVLFLFFLVPSLEELFSGRTLSPLSNFVFGLSHLLRSSWHWLALFSALIGGSIFFAIRQKSVQRRLEELYLKMPYVKRLYMESKLVRFTRLLATLLKGDVSLVAALSIARGALGSSVLEKALTEVEEAVKAGGKFSRELARYAFFPQLMLRMAAIGEEGGVLGAMLEKVSLLYEEMVEKRIARLTALLPTLFLIGIGLWIALIVMAILMPLTDVSTFLDN